MLTKMKLKMMLQIVKNRTELLCKTPLYMISLRHASGTSWMMRRTQVVIPKIDKYILWQRVDTENVTVDVSYLDTGARIQGGVQTAVVVPDIPGSHIDVGGLIADLSRNGVRVIVPNFPGLGFSKEIVPVDEKYENNRLFRPFLLFAAYCHWILGDPEKWQIFRKQMDYVHTTTERANFLMAFLAAIGIKNPDVVVAHGMNAHPVLMIAANASKDMFKSIVLVTPTPHKPCKAFRPYSLICWLADMWQFNYLNRPIILLAMQYFGKSIGRKGEPSAHIAACAMAMRGQGELGVNGIFVDVVMDGDLVKGKKIPITYIMSEDDVVVESSLSMEFADILGINEEHFDKYKGGVKQRPGVAYPSGRYIKGVALDDGTHFAQFKYCELVTKEILDILRHVKREQLLYYTPKRTKSKEQDLF